MLCHAQRAHDERLHNTEPQVVLLVLKWQQTEIGDQTTAVRRTATAGHRPVVFVHRRRVVEAQFLFGRDVAQRDEPPHVGDAGVGCARVIQENHWGWQVEVSVVVELKWICFRIALGDCLGERNDWPGEFEDALPECEMSRGENASAQSAVCEVNRIFHRRASTKPAQ